MDKESLKQHLLSIQQNLIKELEERIQTVHSMVDIDESDTIDPEDFSHQYESAEFEQLIKVQLNKAQGNIKRLDAIDFSEKTEISPGAFVRTDKFNFIIGFSTLPFDFEDMHIVGISCQSPIYPMMLGKKKGDSFSFGGRQYTIQHIS